MQQKKTIAIVGTGMIASSLAVLTSGNGYRTIVLARSQKSADRFREVCRRHWNAIVAEGITDGEQVEICETYVTVTESYRDLSGAEFVFEAVTEDPHIKQEVYRALAKDCPGIQVIASCTSALTPQMLTDGLTKEEYADRILVAHPFNPVHMVPYVELCKAPITREGLMEEAVALLEDLGRVPVVLKKPTPGFIGNRLQFALFRECMALVEEGVCDYRDIDKALNYSFCPRYTSIGIFEHFDAAGLELDSRNCALLYPALSCSKEVPEIITQKLREGKGGKKDGEGFYDWRNVDEQAYEKRVNAPYWRFCRYSFPKERL